jgi:hypothetical protein
MKLAMLRQGLPQMSGPLREAKKLAAQDHWGDLIAAAHEWRRFHRGDFVSAAILEAVDCAGSQIDLLLAAVSAGRILVEGAPPARRESDLGRCRKSNDQ